MRNSIHYGYSMFTEMQFYLFHFLLFLHLQHFTVKGLDLFARFLFEEILELYDFDFKGKLISFTSNNFLLHHSPTPIPPY